MTDEQAELAAEFGDRLRREIYPPGVSVAYVSERDDPIFAAIEAAEKVFAEMARDRRPTPARPTTERANEAYHRAAALYPPRIAAAIRWSLGDGTMFDDAQTALIEEVLAQPTGDHRKTPDTGQAALADELERQRIALADALRLSHALTMDDLIHWAGDTWEWAAKFFAGRAEMRRERDEARAALAASRAPAASEPPDDEDETSYVQWGAAWHEEMLSERRPATSEDAIEQATRVLHDADCMGSFDNHSERVKNMYRKRIDALADAGLLATEPLHEWQCPGCGATTRAQMADASPDTSRAWDEVHGLTRWKEDMIDELSKLDDRAFAKALRECKRQRDEAQARIEKALALYAQPTDEVSKLKLLKQIRVALTDTEKN